MEIAIKILNCLPSNRKHNPLELGRTSRGQQSTFSQCCPHPNWSLDHCRGTDPTHFKYKRHCSLYSYVGTVTCTDFSQLECHVSADLQPFSLVTQRQPCNLQRKLKMLILILSFQAVKCDKTQSRTSLNLNLGRYGYKVGQMLGLLFFLHALQKLQYKKRSSCLSNSHVTPLSPQKEERV